MCPDCVEKHPSKLIIPAGTPADQADAMMKDFRKCTSFAAPTIVNIKPISTKVWSPCCSDPTAASASR